MERPDAIQRLINSIQKQQPSRQYTRHQQTTSSNNDVKYKSIKYRRCFRDYCSVEILILFLDI